ncbi:YheC/YheD family protein [Brevibacillus brevis]|uniref:YheC/YheD family endospore coat-associated protein n=1 Tax=Brevibacillus brevis TaxID=1393 RepID=UPI001158E0BC|nr:YheC/YheD family protein [Lysinibacillus sp. SDF0063]TQR33421.1 YheC/YheD family protein [Lysinibacillus sp. SDF0063]
MRKRIGVLTYRGESGFVEPGYLRRLVEAGREMGAEVFLFSPQDVRFSEKRINGFVPDGKKWRREFFPWPDIVIDRYRYYPLPKHSAYLPFRKQNWFRYANNRFSNKYVVHQILIQDPQLQRWLPETLPYERKTLATMLANHRLVYLKPTNGTGGRSILRVEKRAGRYLLHGRTKQQAKSCEKMATLTEVCERLEHWMKNEKSGNEQFFLQQGLQLSLVPKRTVDARLLVQKDGKGQWCLTGMGIRVGPIQSSTSNLHGGGTALPAVSFLVKRFGQEMAERIVQECKELAIKTVTRIEEHFGLMMEFGFDLGIDVHGRVWIIEINPKPGREIFKQMRQHKRYATAVRRPLEYALYLVNKSNAAN